MIDLRSDTVTQPTDAMRQAMASAPVGDDVYGDDPTTLKLESLAAELMGKEAALFVPSGTMANQLAIMTHTRRGDEAILGKNSHIVAHEVGAAAVISGVNYCALDLPHDLLTAEAVASHIREADIHYPDTGLICLENALGNGRVLPLEDMSQIYEVAKAHEIPLHLDGARIFNAATHLGVSAKDVAQYSDSLMFCLSKGLCAPVGSLLVGSRDFIRKAKRNRKLLGGGMRQTGILAAAGLIALEEMTQRLHIDHDNAKYLGEKLAELSYVSIDTEQIHINLVFFELNIPNASGLAQHLLDHGIKINGPEHGKLFRFVTHNWVSKADIDQALALIQAYAAQ